MSNPCPTEPGMQTNSARTKSCSGRRQPTAKRLYISLMRIAPIRIEPLR
jgi:hypothetical protein